MEEYLRIFQNKEFDIDKELFSSIMKKINELEFEKSFKRYNKKYVERNSFDLSLLNNPTFYKQYVEEANLTEIKALIFCVTKYILNDSKVDISVYRDVYTNVLIQLIKKEEEFRFYCTFKTIGWIKAVIYQGYRIILLDNKEEKIFEQIHSHQRDCFLAMEDIKDNRYLRSMEEHFFIIAMGKSVDFLKRIEDVNNNISEVLSKIDGFIGINKIEDLRNMREHDDDYIEGMGNFPIRFFQTSTDGYCKSDATSTIINCEKEHWLGLKVEVRHVISLYEEILPKVEFVSNEIMKS